VVVFALLFKLDIAALEPMTRPFWVDRGFSLTEIGAVLTTGRIIATLAGAALGGVCDLVVGNLPRPLDYWGCPGIFEPGVLGDCHCGAVESRSS
jgi:hypothetical protein